MKPFIELLWARVPHVAGLAVALVGMDSLRNVQWITEASGQPYFRTAFEEFSNWFLMSLVIVAIISACESALHQGWRRATVQSVFLASGVLAYAYWVGTSPLLTIQHRALGMEAGPALLMYVVWLGWAMSALLSWFYWAHEKARRASVALRTSELARERTQQRLLESRLQVLEAQVEPRFLFDALSRVQRLYEDDPHRADLALDDLINYLRAALPQQRERASTLGREFNLVEAYLRIASTASHTIRRPHPDVQASYAPPMILLPIVQLALGAAQSIAMHVEETPGRVAVQVEFAAASDWDADSQLQSLHATMSLLFGSEGRLVVFDVGTKAAVSVSWPVVAAMPEPAFHLQTT